MEVNLSYGISLRNLPGVLTPYSETSLLDDTNEIYRLGTRWEYQRYHLDFVGEHKTNNITKPSNRVLLPAEIEL